MSTQYVTSVGYTAVAQWAATHVYAAGAIVRQLATPTVGNERCFRTTLGGISGATEPTWVLTVGSSSPTDGTIVDWVEVTGNQTYQVSGGAWNAPHIRIANALASGWAGAGDNVFVRSDHNYTSPSGQNPTYTSLGTVTSPINIICVASNCSIPPISANITTGATENPSNFGFTFAAGFAYVNGIFFRLPNSNSAGSNIQYYTNSSCGWSFENCTSYGGFFASQNFEFGAISGAIVLAQSWLRFKNNTWTFTASGQRFLPVSCNIEIVGGSLTNTAPTTLIVSPSTNTCGQFYFRNVDLSLMGSGSTLVGVLTAPMRVVFEKCKLGSSVVVSAQQTLPGVVVDLISSDSGATNYRNERYSASGNLTTETTVVMSGGASDGTTPFSHKIVTSSQCTYGFPFESFPMSEFYVGITGSAISQTFELLTGGVTLTNKGVWVELEYFSSSSFPLGSTVTSGTDVLNAGTNLTTSTATWTTTGVSSPMPQKIVLTWTPQMKGWYRPVLKSSLASTTLWLNPPAAKAA